MLHAFHVATHSVRLCPIDVSHLVDAIRSHNSTVRSSAESDTVFGFPCLSVASKTNPSRWIEGGGTACRSAELAWWFSRSRDGLEVQLQTVGEGGVSAAGAFGADGGGQGAAGSGQDDQFPGPGDAGAEQVALEHHP